MQGVMIQDFSTGPQGRKISAAGGSQEQAEQPFGQILAVEAEKNGGEVENFFSESMGAEDEGRENTAAAPFFMTALFNESVPFVKVSDNAEFIAAAERTQELIGAWLQPQQEVNGEDGLEEIMTAALEVLEQSEINGAERTQPILSQEETTELRALIAGMLQSGQVKTSFEGHPLVAELQKQLELVLPLTVAKDPAGPSEKAVLPADAESTSFTTESAPQAQLNPGIQERPIAGFATESAPQAQLNPGMQERPIAGFATESAPQAQLNPGMQERPIAGFATESAPQAQLNSGMQERPITGFATESAPQAQLSSGLQEKQIALMLKPQHQQPALHGQQELKVQAGTEAPQDLALNLDAENELNSDIPLETAKAGVLPQNSNLQAQSGIQVGTATQRLEPHIEMTAVKLMQLPSGQRLAESQLVDQVVAHLSGSVDGESGRMRLRLNPAELGSLRLDLIVEGDRVRAHLQAQSQQVQEVLDRHLPQLRDSLQQQGLKIDEFRVDVQTGKDQDSGPNFAWQQQQQKEHSPQSPWLNDDWPQQDVEIPLQQLLQEGSGGISLRV